MFASYLRLPRYDVLTLIAINAGKSDARAISKFADMSRNKIYDSLRNLELLDFIEIENKSGHVSYKLVSDFEDRMKKLLQDSINDYIDFVEQVKSKYDFELSLYHRLISEVSKGVRCFGCGKRTLLVSQLKMYPHENGIAVPDEKNNQWVSFECKCGYNTSWSKILTAKESKLRQSYKRSHKAMSTGGRKK